MPLRTEWLGAAVLAAAVPTLPTDIALMLLQEVMPLVLRAPALLKIRQVGIFGQDRPCRVVGGILRICLGESVLDHIGDQVITAHWHTPNNKRDAALALPILRAFALAVPLVRTVVLTKLTVHNDRTSGGRFRHLQAFQKEVKELTSESVV